VESRAIDGTKALNPYVYDWLTLMPAAAMALIDSKHRNENYLLASPGPSEQHNRSLLTDHNTKFYLNHDALLVVWSCGMLQLN
jgi:hypothetical protein